MLRYIIANWLSFLLPTFYKRIQAHNLHYLETKDPVIIAMNHPNAFTDPIVLSYVSFPMRLHYMARGDAFKPGLISWLLEKIGIVPIFRIQDAGKEGLKKNDETYRRVNRLLAKNAKVMVFAEGLCVQERRLRPLKKGVARMVFGAYKHLGHDRLKVIPVGVNYSKPDKFRSKLLYTIGEPILVRDFIDSYDENPARAMNTFLQHLQTRMKDLVIHIENPEHDDVVHWIEKLRRKDMVLEQGRDPKQLISEFEVSKQIITKVEGLSRTQPELIDNFKRQASNYFTALKTMRLKDWLFRNDQQSRNNYIMLSLRILLLMCLLPLYIAGMFFNFPPLILTHSITRKIVKDVEFFSSFAFGVAMLVFPAFYALWFLFFYKMAGNLPGALGLCLLAGLSGWACLFIHPLVLQTIGLARYLRNLPEMEKLRNQRSRLLELINKF